LDTLFTAIQEIGLPSVLVVVLLLAQLWTIKKVGKRERAPDWDHFRVS